jgi:biopolymer transport protein ExbD
MAASTNDGDEAISAINVTPFVDIVLVLLIILMVTSAQIVKAALEVELPRAASGADRVESALNVVLKRDGEIRLDGSRITREQLAQKVRSASRSNPKIRAVIAADKGVPYGDVVQMIDVVKGNGVRSFALDVERQAGGE